MLFMSLVLAVILFEGVGGWQVYRSILFMPYILSIPVVGIVFGYIFQLNGILNTFLRAVGLDLLAADWLGSSRFALWTVMGVIVWKEFGFGVVLFLARLMSVEEELYEAASLEGARWLQVLFRITIPQLATVIEFYVVIMVITMLSWVFNYVYVMTSGGPGNATMVAEYYIYLEGFRYNLQGVAAAASMVLLAITALLILLRGNITRRIELE
jgi:ABC-type sugar transport system permease subunit